MNKRVVVIIGSLTLVIILATAGYFIFNKNQDSQTPSFGSDAPFGESGQFGERTPATQNGSFSQAENENFVVSSGEIFASLRKISDAPVSGATSFLVGSTTKIRFLEKATGHVYETESDSSVIKRVTNTTIPKVEEVIWERTGNSLILRFEKDGNIESFYAKISTSTATSTQDGLLSLEGSFLPQTISTLAVTDKTDRIAYLISRDPARVFVSNFDGSKPTLAWSNQVEGWQIKWAGDSTLSLTTNASFTADGYLYFLNLKTGGIKKIVGDVKGLSTLPNYPGTWIIYSSNRGGFLSLLAWSSKDGGSRTIPVQTLPEKCVWSKKKESLIYCGVPSQSLAGEYPDTWYQGLTLFSDFIWSINLETGETQQLADIKSLSGEEVDALDLKLSPNEDLLLFRNKKDFSLWTLKLEAPQQSAQ